MLGDRYDAHRQQDKVYRDGAANMGVSVGLNESIYHISCRNGAAAAMGVSASVNESIYHISGEGTVTLVQRPPGQGLGKVYTDTLQCNYFTVLDEHTGCGHTILLIADDEALLRGPALNNIVSDIVGSDIHGAVLLVCLNEVGDDGDDDNLADFKDFYKAMGTIMNKCDDYVSKYSRLSMQQRALELLELFKV